jgi:DNA polymerase III epsilon subunit-like protein
VGGYRRGQFKYVLAIDTETSGYNRENLDVVRASRYALEKGANPDAYYQMLSIALIVLEFETFKAVDKLYVEIKWDGVSQWDDGAAKVHGLTKEYLDKNGLPEEEAVAQVLELILKYWGPENHIVFLGHNVPFDIRFLMETLRRYDIDIKISGRFIDTNSVGMTLLGTFSSDELFEAMSLPPRDKHNAMEDIEFTVESMRRIRNCWKTLVEGE